jgi:hypothetical protein
VGLNFGGNFVLRQGYSEMFFANDTATNDPVYSTKDIVVIPGKVGDFRLPMVKSLDARVEKMFKFDRAQLGLDVDIFNVLNSGTVLGRIYDVDASNFNDVAEIMNPRIVRFGVRSSSRSMRLVLLLAVALAAAGAPPQQGEPIDRVLGAWQGRVEHDGESRDVILEFVRSRDRVVMLVSTPAIHAWRFPVAVVSMSGNRITSGGLAIDFDPSADTLTTTIPSDLVPKYRMKTMLRRREAVVPEARRQISAPIRMPAWTVSLGAATWADAAWLDGQVVVGAEDGRLHAFDDHGRRRWTFKAGGAIRSRASQVGSDLVVPADDGGVYRIDWRTGKARWTVKIGEPVTRVALADPASRYENRAAAVVVEGNRLFTGTHDGRILALDARSGATTSRRSTRRRAPSPGGVTSGSRGSSRRPRSRARPRTSDHRTARPSRRSTPPADVSTGPPMPAAAPGASPR